jgi:hypothetical protein
MKTKDCPKCIERGGLCYVHQMLAEARERIEAAPDHGKEPA